MQSGSLVEWHRANGALLSEVGSALLPQMYKDRDAEIEAARTGAGLADLSQVPVLTLAGEEIRRWANGMFTNNIRKLQPGQGNRSAMCDDRGRVEGLLDLYCLDATTFLAVLEGADGIWFEERYRMFMVLDDIEMEDVSAETSILSLLGPTASGTLLRAGLPAPTNAHDHQAADFQGVPVRVARKQRTGLGGFDVLVPNDAALAVWEALLGAGASPIGHAALDALRILGGRARWPEDGGAKTLIHELALEGECCAFDKGCYVGQEVINRVDVKGTIQKHLTGVVVSGQASPPPGSRIFLGDVEVGVLTSVAWYEGRAIGLSVLRRAAWEPGTALTVVSPDEARWEAQSAGLPFVF